ncbi:MAG TPA: ATP-binding protein, partial [Polyangia bacterium]|nr:ATP-binding protein [Polyangia bacterium]
KNIKVETEVPRAGLTVLGDESRLRQVIGNLLSNAVKFTQAGGRIVIRLLEEDDQAIITVSDDGEGIDDALLPHIFEPFRQQDGTPVRRHEGLGLGLSIVKELVALHGGSVSAVSAGKNQGATFTVKLPITEDTPAERTPLASPPKDDSALKGVRVLIIEDQEQTREVLAMILGWVGATVTTAESAESGRAALARSPVDVVLCDIAMPQEDGYTFVGRRRQQEKESGISPVPVLALTAHATADDRRRALQAGFDLHFAKPVDPEELIAAIVRLTGGVRRASADRP